MLKKIVLVTGPNGAGKEYVCGNVLPVTGIPFNYRVLSTCLKKFSLPAEEVKKIGEGNLISDSFVCQVVEKIIDDASEDRVLVIDGFPRNEVQATFISANYLCRKDCHVAILHIDASKKTCLEAMLRRARTKKTRRIDDNRETFEKRWRIYEDFVLPGIRRTAEDFSVFTVYGGIHIPDEVKLAPVLRMFKKLGCYPKEDPDAKKLLADITFRVKVPSGAEIFEMLKIHPSITRECPPVCFDR